MNPTNYLFLKSGVDAVQGGTKGLVSSNKKKAATDAGEGGNEEGDENAALLQRQNRAKKMLSRREPTGDVFTDYIQPSSAQFFGVLLLIYVEVVAQLSPSAVVRGAAHGLTLGALMLCFQDVSVGCFNPALTVAILIVGCGEGTEDFRLLHWRLALCLIGAQMLAGIIGAALARATLSYPISGNNVSSNNVSSNNVSSNNVSSNITAFEMAKGGVPYLSPGVGGFQGFLCETILTCLLATILLMTLVDTAPFPEQPLAAVAVGMVAMAATSATVDVTGGVLNPARSLGPALVGCDLPSTKFADQLVYLSAPFVGAGIAAALYRILFASSDKRMFFTGDEKSKKKKPPVSGTANSKASEPKD